jgi:ADP-L-glycero-D-manno-heptose 6-epimerase
MIVVTGAAGFIGSAFVAKLNEAGVTDIIVVDELNTERFERNLANKSYSTSIDKQAFIEQIRTDTAPSSISAIIHLGACSSTTEKNVTFLNENNLEYSKDIIGYCTKKNIRCIYASSAATYGDGTHGYSDDESSLEIHKPLNLYGNSKHQCDLWARDTGALNHVAGLKFFNVYGPNEYYKGDMASVAWKAFNTITETGEFKLFRSHRDDFADGEQKRDFVYVKDCCEVMWWLLHNPDVNGIFNVGSGKARSWNDLLGAVFEAMNRESAITYIDMPESLRNQYQYFTEAPMQKLRDAGYSRPLYSLEDGIRDYVQNHLVQEDRHW